MGCSSHCTTGPSHSAQHDSFNARQHCPYARLSQTAQGQGSRILGVQILDSLPSSLLHSVLEAACNTCHICQFIHGLPRSFHNAVLHAHAPSAAQRAHVCTLRLPWHEAHAEGSVCAMRAAVEAYRGIVALELCHSDAWEYVGPSDGISRCVECSLVMG